MNAMAPHTAEAKCPCGATLTVSASTAATLRYRLNEFYCAHVAHDDQKRVTG